MRPTISRNDEPAHREPGRWPTSAREAEVNRNYDFTSLVDETTSNKNYDFSQNPVSPRITASDMSQPLVALQKAESAALRKVVGQNHVIPELVRTFYQHVRRGISLLEGQHVGESETPAQPTVLSGPPGVGKQTCVAAISAAFCLPLVAVATTDSGSDDLTVLADQASTELCSRGRDLYLEEHADPVTRSRVLGEAAATAKPRWSPICDLLLDQQINLFCRYFGVLLVTPSGTSTIDASALQAQVIDRLDRSTEANEDSTTLPPPNLLYFDTTSASAEGARQKSHIFDFHRLGRSHLETIAARKMDQLARRLDGTAFPDLSRIGKIRIRRDCVGVIADQAIRDGTASSVQRIIEQLPVLLSTHVRHSATNVTSTGELEVTAELLRNLFRDRPGGCS